MTGSVETDDLVQGCVKWLLDDDDVRAVLGVYDETGAPWLYQHELWVRVEGTGSTAAVISRAGGWAGGNIFNSLEFPRLMLEIYADPIRDDYQNVVNPGEIYRRIEAAWRVFDRVLHRPSGEEVWWGDVRTVASVRLTEPSIAAVPDGDGVLRLQSFYAVTQG